MIVRDLLVIAAHHKPTDPVILAHVTDDGRRVEMLHLQAAGPEWSANHPNHLALVLSPTHAPDRG